MHPCSFEIEMEGCIRLGTPSLAMCISFTDGSFQSRDGFDALLNLF